MMRIVGQGSGRLLARRFPAWCFSIFLVGLGLAGDVQAFASASLNGGGSVTTLRDLSRDTCATVSSASDEASLTAASCGSFGDAQRYTFVKLSDGKYEINTFDASSYCLTHEGSVVTSSACSNDASQEWLVQVVSSGMMLETADGASCLTDSADWNSNATTMEPCTAGPNQTFQNGILTGDDGTCGATPNGGVVWIDGATGATTAAASAQQCSVGGTVTTTWRNQTQEVCTQGTLTSTGQTRQTNLATAAPVCDAAPAACGSTPSGGTIWVDGGMGSSVSAATSQQCVGGGTITTTWINQSQEVCTNGSLTGTGLSKRANVLTGAPVCHATSAGAISLSGISPLRDVLHDECATVQEQGAGAVMEANSCGGSAGQYFRFSALSDGRTKIGTFSGGTYCLAYSGSGVASTVCSGDSSQEWQPLVVSSGIMLATVDGKNCLADPADWTTSATTVRACDPSAANEVFKIGLVPMVVDSGSSVEAEGSGGAAGTVTVLAASVPSQTAPPGATVNLAANFTAVSPPGTAYTLGLSLIDGSGKTVASTTDTLAQDDSMVPTTGWKGAITVVRSLTVPAVADGTYRVMVSLIDPLSKQAIVLSSGPGVTQDGQNRYAVGTVTVKASAPAPSLVGPATLDLTGFRMTFDDEFQALDLSDGFAYDGSKWYTHNQQCCMQSTDGSGTHMYGMNDAVNPYSIVPGGGLDIRLQKIGNDWSSGVMTSVDNTGAGFSQMYGYFEMSARFPNGLNTWPAFWLFNTSSKASGAPQGEIDVVEYIANPGFIHTIRTTVHDYGAKTSPAYSWNQVTNPSDGNFHRYGMLWTAETTTFYFDGAVYFACPTPEIMQQPYYMLVDLGLGSGYPTEGTPAVNDMIVRWVRAYTLPVLAQ